MPADWQLWRVPENSQYQESDGEEKKGHRFGVLSSRHWMAHMDKGLKDFMPVSLLAVL